MIIRQQQVDTFESTESTYFEPRTVLHLKQTFPRHCEILKDAGLPEVVHYAVERCRRYRITKAPNVQLFADLTFLLGRSFDSDPQLPWAAAALNDPETGCQNRRSERLHAEAMAYLERVSGPGNEFIGQARTRLLADAAVPPAGEFEGTALNLLQEVFPEKYREIGETGARALIAEGARKVARRGIESGRGRLLYVGFMYLFGAGFDEDPLFAWAAESLQAAAGEPERVEPLHRAAVAYLKQWSNR